MQLSSYSPSISPRSAARWSQDLSAGTRAAGTTDVPSQDVNSAGAWGSRTASIATIFSAYGISENASRAQGISAGTATHWLTVIGSSTSVSGPMDSAGVAATGTGASNGTSSIEAGRRELGVETNLSSQWKVWLSCSDLSRALADDVSGEAGNEPLDAALLSTIESDSPAKYFVRQREDQLSEVQTCSAPGSPAVSIACVPTDETSASFGDDDEFARQLEAQLSEDQKFCIPASPAATLAFVPMDETSAALGDDEELARQPAPAAGASTPCAHPAAFGEEDDSGSALPALQPTGAPDNGGRAEDEAPALVPSFAFRMLLQAVKMFPTWREASRENHGGMSDVFFSEVWPGVLARLRAAISGRPDAELEFMKQELRRLEARLADLKKPVRLKSFAFAAAAVNRRRRSDLADRLLGLRSNLAELAEERSWLKAQLADMHPPTTPPPPPPLPPPSRSRRLRRRPLPPPRPPSPPPGYAMPPIRRKRQRDWV